MYEGRSELDNYSTIELRQDTTVDVFKDIYTTNIEQLHVIDPVFTKKLVKAGFFQSGFNKTFFSWAELIPPSLLTPLLADNLGEVDQFDFKLSFLANRPEFKKEFVRTNDGEYVQKDGKTLVKYAKPTNRPLYTELLNTLRYSISNHS